MRTQEPIITPERRQHDRVTRAADQVADAAGAIGSPWRVEGLLARLERHGDIGVRERMAGEEFRRLFHLAALDPLRAADMGQRMPTSIFGEPHSSARAHTRLNLALDVLGGLHSPCGTCAWFVLGLDLSMRDWALREGWGSRPLRPEVAKGTLIGTLGVLAKHFGV